ncbi:MAG: hypothetical protein K8R92_04295 [Planctomycetes bacterium]|nr:hypothetical protein [Planctomycetota bacterium]
MAPPRIAFHDDVGKFGPMLDLRVAAEVRSGIRCNFERLGVQALTAPKEWSVPLEKRSGLPVNALPDGESMMFLTGRLMELPSGLNSLAVGHAMIDSVDGGIVAAHVTRATAEHVVAGRGFDVALKTTPRIDLSILHRPWDLLESDGFDRRMAADAKAVHTAWKQAKELAEKPAKIAAITGDVTIHASAEIGKFVVLDARGGPIVIGPNTHIGPHAVIIGPASIGEGSHIAPHAVVKARSVIGPRCKVGGEVGSLIMQGNSNKTHDGHLGDSIVGSWVNLGAGTLNSNLLNTYGEVSMQLEAGAGREKTGRTFMGCVIGDHVKCAIGTRIMTGCVLGTGAMIASSTPPALYTERFTWRTDAGESVYQLDKFLAVAEVVMARRQTVLSPQERAILTQLHARAAART